MGINRKCTCLKMWKKHLSSKQTERQRDRPRTRLRPRPRPRTRPRAPSLELRLQLPWVPIVRMFVCLFVCLFVFFTELQLAWICYFSKSCNFFFSGYDFSGHLYGEAGIRIRSSRVEIFEYAMNPECVDAKSGHFLIWWRSSVLLLY